MSTTVYEFDADAASPLAYLWQGKLNLLPHSASFNYCQVEAADYADIVLRIYGDGVLLFETTVTSDEPFTLPMSNEYHQFQAELIGTSRVYTVQFVEDILELQ